MQIDINKPAVVDIGNHILDLTKELERHHERLNSFCYQLSKVWVGEDATAYVNTFKEQNLASFSELIKILEEYGEYVKKTPGAYQTLDTAYSNRKIKMGD